MNINTSKLKVTYGFKDNIKDVTEIVLDKFYNKEKNIINIKNQNYNKYFGDNAYGKIKELIFYYDNNKLYSFKENSNLNLNLNNLLNETKIIQIFNDDPVSHFEIIESIIIKIKDIFKIKEKYNLILYLYYPKPNNSFKKYISDKYSDIFFGKVNNFDYFIECTIFSRHWNNINKDINSIKKYISHDITEELLKNPNVYYLTPLAKKNVISADILPFMEQKTKIDIPIYIIQGNLNHSHRRNKSLLIKILSKNYKHKFIIKMIGWGKFPKELEEYKNKIQVKANLNFIDYHKEFLNAYGILPLTTKKSNIQYYTKKLTSTINYAKGYDLKCIIDKDLQNIYKLKNVEVFNDINDICNAFEKSLNDFYNS